MIVLDTNIVLDAFLFNDPGVQPLKRALAARQIRWLATLPMRDELVRVLAYPKIMAQLLRYQHSAAAVLAQFDDLAQQVEVAAPVGIRCRDPDDQKFIDLAVAHQSTLLSKDGAVLCLAKRLLTLNVRVHQALDFVA